MSEVRLCECGCGQPVKPGKRFIFGHHLKGSTNPRYKGGLYFSRSKGRWVIICRDGAREYYARAVMECKLGRILRPDEVVHHKDGCSWNDDPDNLELMPRPKHDLLSATRYTADELLNALRRFYAQYGHPPTGIDFMTDERWPHPSTYRRVFGRWNNALQLAGIPVHRKARWHK